MTLPNEQTNYEETLSRRRFRAAVELRGLTVDGLARSCEVSYRHLCYVFAGQRTMTAALLAKIRDRIGESGWAFATGQTDSLIDSPPTMPPGESEGLAMGGER